MFRKSSIYSILILLLVLTGCSSSEREVELVINHNNDEKKVYNASTDYQYYFHQQAYGQRITESEYGFYFINGSYLYYMEKDNFKPILLDNNPSNDCSPHTDEKGNNCNAYIQLGLYKGFLSYYKQRLYIVEGGESLDKDTFGEMQYRLLEMNKDGTSRKVIRSFDFMPTTISIHRDFLYFQQYATNESGLEIKQIVRVPISNADNKPEVLYSMESDLHAIDVIPYDNSLYITEFGRNMYRTIKYDLDKKEREILFAEYEGNVAIDSRMNDKMFFSFFTGDALDESSWQLFSSDLNGKNVVNVPLNVQALNRIFVDDHYLYVEPSVLYTRSEQYAEALQNVKEALVVYNWEHKLIDEIDISFVPRNYNVVNGSNQVMFIRTLENQKENIYYLDKSTIGSKKAEFNLLLESMEH